MVTLSARKGSIFPSNSPSTSVTADGPLHLHARLYALICGGRRVKSFTWFTCTKVWSHVSICHRPLSINTGNLSPFCHCFVFICVCADTFAVVQTDKPIGNFRPCHSICSFFINHILCQCKTVDHSRARSSHSTIEEPESTFTVTGYSALSSIYSCVKSVNIRQIEPVEGEVYFLPIADRMNCRWQLICPFERARASITTWNGDKWRLATIQANGSS